MQRVFFQTPDGRLIPAGDDDEVVAQLVQQEKVGSASSGEEEQPRQPRAVRAREALDQDVVVSTEAAATSSETPEAKAARIMAESRRISNPRRPGRPCKRPAQQQQRAEARNFLQYSDPFDVMSDPELRQQFAQDQQAVLPPQQLIIQSQQPQPPRVPPLPTIVYQPLPAAAPSASQQPARKKSRVTTADSPFTAVAGADGFSYIVLSPSTPVVGQPLVREAASPQASTSTAGPRAVATSPTKGDTTDESDIEERERRLQEEEEKLAELERLVVESERRAAAARKAKVRARERQLQRRREELRKRMAEAVQAIEAAKDEGSSADGGQVQILGQETISLPQQREANEGCDIVVNKSAAPGIVLQTEHSDSEYAVAQGHIIANAEGELILPVNVEDLPQEQLVPVVQQEQQQQSASSVVVPAATNAVEEAAAQSEEEQGGEAILSDSRPQLDGSITTEDERENEVVLSDQRREDEGVLVDECQRRLTEAKSTETETEVLPGQGQQAEGLTQEGAGQGEMILSDQQQSLDESISASLEEEEQAGESSEARQDSAANEAMVSSSNENGSPEKCRDTGERRIEGDIIEATSKNDGNANGARTEQIVVSNEEPRVPPLTSCPMDTEEITDVTAKDRAPQSGDAGDGDGKTKTRRGRRRTSHYTTKKKPRQVRTVSRRGKAGKAPPKEETIPPETAPESTETAGPPESDVLPEAQAQSEAEAEVPPEAEVSPAATGRKRGKTNKPREKCPYCFYNGMFLEKHLEKRHPSIGKEPEEKPPESPPPPVEEGGRGKRRAARKANKTISDALSVLRSREFGEKPDVELSDDDDAFNLAKEADIRSYVEAVAGDDERHRCKLCPEAPPFEAATPEEVEAHIVATHSFEIRTEEDDQAEERASDEDDEEEDLDGEDAEGDFQLTSQGREKRRYYKKKGAKRKAKPNKKKYSRNKVGFLGQPSTDFVRAEAEFRRRCFFS